MAAIALEGMRFYAYHGFYKEEQILGNYYVVDLEVEAPIGHAGKSDDLGDTLNYETLYLIVEKEMQKPAKLLETVIDRIIGAVCFQFTHLDSLSVRIKKLNPPLDGQVAASVVHEKKNFKIQCARCKKSMVCYSNEHCWCYQKERVSPTGISKIRDQFGGTCLCNECLELYL
jgi:dihydroneopterin aldolase